jgi:hypothetical protein
LTDNPERHPKAKQSSYPLRGMAHGGSSIHRRLEEVNANKTNAAWAAILHDDTYEQHWKFLHEKYGTQPTW